MTVVAPRGNGVIPTRHDRHVFANIITTGDRAVEIGMKGGAVDDDGIVAGSKIERAGAQPDP